MSVEENLLAKRERMKIEKKVIIKEEAYSSYVKADHILWKLEKMFDRLTIADNLETKIKNPNPYDGTILTHDSVKIYAP